MTAKTKQQSPFGAVRPDNVRPAAPRRDPDADATPPPPAPAPAPQPEPAPPGPPAADPTPVAPPAADPAQQPSRPAPAAPSAVAPADGGTLASVLTAPHHHPHSVSEGVAALMGLAQMAARPVDPMDDWGQDGTRTPRWLAAAIRQYAQLTGRKTQQVQRDALLGTHPIPGDVLDAAWLNLYGFPREQYRPEAYR